MPKSFLERLQDISGPDGTISDEHAPFLRDLVLDDDYLDLLNVGVYTPSDRGCLSSLSYSPTSDVPLVVAGCSETEGQLVSTLGHDNNQEFMWHNYVASNINVEYVNISDGGISIYKIVDKLIKYLDTHKKPETILALFPPLNTRMWIASDSSDQISVTKSQGVAGDVRAMRLLDIVSSSELAFISKRPHNLDDILPPVSYMAYSINAIKTLETVCKLADISLIYSTWDEFSDHFFLASREYAREKRIPDPFQNYLSTDPSYWSTANVSSPEFSYSDCHSELKSGKASANFHQGLEGHMGTHRQAHIGELFLKELTKHRHTATL